MNSRNTMTRRSLTKGAAWSIPAVTVAAAAPAVAASTPLTGTNDTPQAFVGRYYRVPSDCTATNNDGGGYLDTQGCTPSGGPTSGGVLDGDCLLNPNSSIGYWIETANTTSGTAQITSITTTFTFSSPIQILSCPNGKANVGGTWTWTECTTLNGWTYTLSADGKTLTLTYSGPLTVTTSTTTNKTGTYVPGFFINYQFTSICPTTSTTIATSHSMTYKDKTNATGTTFTKNVTARSVV